MTVRIGTRASKLALTQTQQTADQLAAVGGFPVELVHIRTDGDVLTGSLSQMGGTGVFVAALRDALLRNQCDVAVHSLKDLPTGAALGLTLAATPKRVDVRDVLCARDGLKLADLPQGATGGHRLPAPRGAAPGCPPGPGHRGHPRQRGHPPGPRARPAGQRHRRSGGTESPATSTPSSWPPPAWNASAGWTPSANTSKRT